MKNTNVYSLPQFESEDVFNKEDFNDAFFKIDNVVNDIQTVFDELVINAGSSNAEIVTARKGELSLNNRLGKIDTKISTVNTSIADIEIIKADKGYVDSKTQANNLAYKESYNTLALLQTAYPTGDTFNHTVLADGFIYTYINSAWVSTGIQANGTGIPDTSINEVKLDQPLKDKINESLLYRDLENADFSSNSVINYDKETHILTVPTIPGTGYPIEHFVLSQTIDNVEVVTPPVSDVDYKWVILAKNTDGNYIYLSVVAPTPNASFFMKIGVCNATNRTYVTYNTVPTKYSSLPKLGVGVKLKITHVGNYVYKMVTVDVNGVETLWTNFDLKDYYPNATTGTLANANLGVCALDAENKSVYLKSTIKCALSSKFDSVQEQIDELSTKQSTDLIAIQKQINDVAINRIAKWNGKKVNFLGDSITYGFTPITYARMANPYPVIVGQLQGLNTVRNYGINMSTITNNSANAMSVRYASMNDDADVICVFGGSNDFGIAPADIGTIADTTNATFYGALKTLIEGLINKYPTKTIFFITPLHREDENVVNSKGHVLNDYVKVIREVCEIYSMPLLDLYKYSGLNPAIPIHLNTYILDGLHPTEVWHREFLARKISAFMESL